MRMPFFVLEAMRRKKTSMVVGLSALLMAAILYGLQISDRAMERQMENVMTNTRVTCAVTNLTGTQVDDLDMPAWVPNLFQPVSEKTIHVPETSFLDYVTDICLKTTLDGTLCGGWQKVSLVGLNCLAADRDLDPEAATIVWQDGYDEQMLVGDRRICLLSNELYEDLNGQDGWDGTVQVMVSGKFGDRTITMEALTVAGVVYGPQAVVYCPWQVAVDASYEVNDAYYADSISATIADNRKIDEFQEKCVDIYFATVDPEAKPQPWEASPIYVNYPYAFEIYDEMLQQSLDTLQRNQLVFRLCQKLAVGITLLLGLVIGSLTARQQQKELALKYVLGCSRLRIVWEMSASQLLISLLGGTAAVVVLFVLSGTTPPWKYLLLALAANYLGVVLAACKVFISKDLLQITKEEH